MHRWSEVFIPTLREAPADAEVASHKFLIRAGYIRQLAAGVFSYLFLGQRSLNKIIAIVREEMDKIGQEFYLPALQPRDIWEASGRWSTMGDNLFRLRDRKGTALCLGMTAEEVMTDIARRETRSYKQLPQIWYQIQTKFRDEPRPRAGLLRVRQFVMKDSYSFDIDAASLDVSYLKHYDTYRRIFDQCGLKYVVAEAHSGAMGGSQSSEFLVRSDAGEDLLVTCGKCGYAANMEKSVSRVDVVADLPSEGNGEPVLVHTPGVKTIEDLARFLNVSPKNNMKTLAYVIEEADPLGKAQTQPLVAFMRGDHQLNEAKLSSAIGGRPVRPMQAEEIFNVFGSPAGFLGPIGLKIALLEDGHYGPGAIVLLDEALKGRENLIAGANKEDYHLKNVTPGRDFQPTRYTDLRMITAGEPCTNCGEELGVDSAIEIGHIFKLGSRYSEAMGARVLDRSGTEIPPLMGSYGIGIERVLVAAVEQNHDQDGFWLPPRIAPFEVIVTPISVRDYHATAAATDIAQALTHRGLDVILDDRDERPGVKFKDADLVGIPFRINVGKKVTEGTVEVVNRSTREIRDASITAIAEYMQELVRPQ
ncbi:MAG TPA: proline--tRNA ligase [Terriglobales bacterium]|nr:proline--tRNA ligase [Terriglobales bacterium]